MVDHRDRDPSNNRWLNLRQATRSQNQWNVGMHAYNGIGLKGVSRARNRFKAEIRVEGERIHLGNFDTPQIAHAAYWAAAASVDLRR